MTPWSARTWIATGCLALVGLLPAPPPAAAPAPGFRPCVLQAMVGVWDVVRIATPPGSPVAIDNRNPAFYPHQRFVFHQDGTAQHLTSAAPIAATVGQALPGGRVKATWTLDSQSMLTLRPSGGGAPEPALCGYLTQANPQSAGLVRAGDVLLTYYRDEHPVLFRHLRRAS